MPVTIEVNDETYTSYTVVLDDNDHILTTVTDSAADVEDWLSEILRIHRRRLHHLCVGLDIEWRPGYDNPVAVLQLCVGRRCLVFQVLYADYIPDSLANFLLDGRFQFFGVGIAGDVEKLICDCGLSVGNAVDLRDLAMERMGRRDVRQMGLRRLAEEVLGVVVDKPRRIQTSRWDSEFLNYNQIKYACVDAFLSFEIGRSLSDQ